MRISSATLNLNDRDSRMMRVNGFGAAVLAILAAAGANGVISPAEAEIYYWQDSDPGLSRPGPTAPQRRPRPRHHGDKKAEMAAKEAAKPQGPLIVSISIAQQKMRIYDAHGFFAETPVSTGMPGHPTPMGVFSVIQKQKFHRSNIYSGAPMPYMQRITWSGVAMHAGVLPGRPASHGCIRMPMAFAMKMWNWTRMGARVVITPGEITPASFSHPLLATLRVPSQPIAADEAKPDVPVAAKLGTAAETEANAKSVIAETGAEPRSTVGHHDSAKPAADETQTVPAQTQTADATNTLSAMNPSVTLSDAAPVGGSTPPAVGQAVSDQAGDSSKTGTKSEASKSETEPETAKHDDVASSGNKAAAEKPVEAKKPVENSKTLATPAALQQPKTDEARPNDAVKAAAPKADPAALSKRNGQIAVFVSRKDSKLYVRQNFAPLFNLPVTIAPSERPLGTHIFTAQVDRDDANVLHWSVVSLPTPTKHADRRNEDKSNSRKRKIAGAGPIEVTPTPAPDTPSEALDRLSLPTDAMARITEALSTGGSIIVSDQGIAAGETGEGTDFIVSLR
jgi:lipoprotein-anchoring transpeptidase ErfK/SrfK